MILKEKAIKFLESIKRHPTRTAALAGLALLTAVTCAKENVHFGSVTIDSPTKNQYSYGLINTMRIKGEANADIYNFGIVAINEFKDSKHTGKSTAVGLVAGIGAYASNAVHNGDSTAVGLLGGKNDYAANAVHNGDSTAVGLIVGKNGYASNAVHNGDSTAVGLVAGIGTYASNAVHNGDSTAVGLLGGVNDYAANAVHNGDSTVRGCSAQDSEGAHFFANKIISKPCKTGATQ